MIIKIVNMLNSGIFHGKVLFTGIFLGFRGFEMTVTKK